MSKHNRSRPTGLPAKERDSNESCPKYIAMCVDSYVEADDDLEYLISLIQKDSEGNDEDVCIWKDYSHIAAIVLADGTVQRIDGTHHIPKLRTVLLRITSPSGERAIAQVTIPFVPNESEESIRAKASNIYYSSYGTACRIEEIVCTHF